MRKSYADFAEALRPHLPGIVCLTGGGGKTTLLYALGKALGAERSPVLCTTTTRIFPPTAEQCGTFLLSTSPAEIEAPRGGHFFCAARPAPAGSAKPAGFAPADLDALSRRHPLWGILVEADGAAGRPVKAPLAHEPVIPSLTRATVAVLGLSGLGRPLDDMTAFRLEHTAGVVGLRPGDILTPEAAAWLFLHPQGVFQYTPEQAARVVFINQADLPGAAEAGEALARAILAGDPGMAGVYIGATKEGLCCTRILL